MKGPPSVISDDSMMDTEKPIAPSVAVDMPHSPTRSYPMDGNIVGTYPQSLAPWMKCKNELPKVKSSEYNSRSNIITGINIGII